MDHLPENFKEKQLQVWLSLTIEKRLTLILKYHGDFDAIWDELTRDSSENNLNT
jgi:hypothetical protein